MNSKFKSLSAAAIVAALGLGGVAKAATYSTGFEEFTPGTTGTFANNATNGAGPVAAVVPAVGNPTQAFGITSSTLNYSDYFNAGTTIPGNTSGTVGVSFQLNRTASVNPAPNSTLAIQPPQTEAGFGIEVLSNTNTVLASLFIENTQITSTNASSVPALFVSDNTGAANTEIFGAAGVAAANGVYGSYSLAVNLDNKQFTVTGPGGTSGPYAFSSAYNGGGLTVNLSSQNQGNGDVGLFDNLSVTSNAVPEPASIAMIGIGSLMLAGRRRKQTA